MTGVFSSEPVQRLHDGHFRPESARLGRQDRRFHRPEDGYLPEDFRVRHRRRQGGRKRRGRNRSGEGTPVVAGGGDAQLGCVGVGVVDANQAAIFGGSFWQYEYNTDEAKTDEHCRVRVNCHSVPGIWQYEALAFKPGMVMRWYRDAFCQYEKELSKTHRPRPYDIMNEKAKDYPPDATA